MQVGAMIASLQYAMQILFAVFMVTAMFVMLPRASASAARINEVLDVAPEIVDPASPVQPRPAPSAATSSSRTSPSSIRAPRSRRSPACRSPRNPGEVTAIIGGTGSGKSTLAGLIPRFYDVNQGRVLVDGVDVREMTQADLRARIGFVPQKAVLFTGTVARTSATAARTRPTRRSATPRRWRRRSSSSTRCPEQFASPVSQGGINLSGGQKQRLAIARAIVRGRTSTSSTTASRRSTSRPTRSCAPRSRARPPTPPCSSSPSASAPSSTPTASSSSTTAGWSAIGTHAELLETSEIYREIVASQVSLEEVA